MLSRNIFEIFNEIWRYKSWILLMFSVFFLSMKLCCKKGSEFNILQKTFFSVFPATYCDITSKTTKCIYSPQSRNNNNLLWHGNLLRKLYKIEVDDKSFFTLKRKVQPFKRRRRVRWKKLCRAKTHLQICPFLARQWYNHIF